MFGTVGHFYSTVKIEIHIVHIKSPEGSRSLEEPAEIWLRVVGVATLLNRVISCVNTGTEPVGTELVNGILLADQCGKTSKSFGSGKS